MAYTPLFMIFISCMLFLLQLLPTITAQYIASNCTYNSSVTNSITYLANLDNLLLSLSSNANATSGTGFYYDTAGDGSDKVYGLYLCRGDLTLQDCQTCVKNASVEIKSNCPNTTAAVTWYVDCMLRYTNVSFFSTLQQEPFRYGAAPNDVTKVDQYNQTVGELMNGLMNQAVDGSTTPKYYAAGAVTYYTKIDTVYGLVQCTPDITQDDCKNCLTGSISIDLLRLIYPKGGGKILKPSCNIRFEFNDQFYHDKVTSTVTDGKRRISRVVIIVIVVIVATFITITIISNLYLRVRRKKQKQKLRVEDDQIEISSVDPIQFNFDTIRSATNNFSDANKLGQGGFGAVYKGMLLDGQMVAVKRLSRNSNQGEIEFKNELILVTKLQHRNLVRVLGFCLEGEEKLLIYEFVPNGSLDHFIFDPIERSKLVWEERYKIIEGIARGLLYLHEDSRLKIIHRDLKASNILLDEEMNPKIADFGMARLFVVDQSRVNTNRIVGTYGYMAPEYIIQGQVSVQIDVFSFGVLLLEIVTGQRSSNVGQSDGSMAGGLLSYAWKKWTEGKASELIDPSLGENYDMSEVMRYIHIGILCVQENASNRPSMASVVVMLNSYSTSLPLPTSAAFVMGSAAFVMGSEIALGKPSMDDSRVKNSKNEMSITDLSGR